MLMPSVVLGGNLDTQALLCDFLLPCSFFDPVVLCGVSRVDLEHIL